MIKINLIKRSTITINEFRTWLNQFIQDKKGALPDLQDWKVIKENLDKVESRSVNDEFDYSILDITDDDECEPYDFQYSIDLLNQLSIDEEVEYTREGLYNDVEYFLNEPFPDSDSELFSCAVREE